MPNMEELISKISAEITKSDGDIWMSKIDLDYAYGYGSIEDHEREVREVLTKLQDAGY